MVVSAFVFSIVGLSVAVESFVLEPASPRTTPRNTHRGNSYFRSRYEPSVPRIGVTKSRGDKTHSVAVWNNSEDDSIVGIGGGGVVESIGLVSQPVVWVSLCFLATTGHGLPAGPGGAIGAVEGIAYLVVLGLALVPVSVLPAGEEDSGSSTLPVDARTLSRITIALGLLVLAGVAAGKGCVPNAKPILDYSAYLPVCGPEP